MPWVAQSGPLVTFRCGACDMPRVPMGRKVLKVRGLRVFVCQACVAERAVRQVARA